MHQNHDKLYITAVKTNPNAELTSISLQTMFKIDYVQFPEVITATQVHVYQKDEIKLSTENHDFKGKAMIVDSTFLEMLDFEAKGYTTSELSEMLFLSEHTIKTHRKRIGSKLSLKTSLDWVRFAQAFEMI